MKVKGIGLWIAILWVIAGILVIVLPEMIGWGLGVALIAVGILTYFKK